MAALQKRTPPELNLMNLPSETFLQIARQVFRGETMYFMNPIQHW
jgi:hypothetical protein